MSPTEPGWYPDPEQGGQDRWWDGDRYTAQTRPSSGDSPPPYSDRPDWASQPTTVFDPSTNQTPGGAPSGGPSGPSYGAAPPFGGSSAPPYGAPPSGSPQGGFGPGSGGFGATGATGYGGGPGPSAPPSGYGQAGPPFGAPGPQPGYGGGFNQPPPAPAKKSSAPWIIGAIAAVVALCCLGGGLLVYLGDSQTATTTTTTRPGVSTPPASTTTTRPTPTTTPGKTETLAAGYKFTHPNWVQDDDSNNFKVWSIRPETTDPSGGKLAVKDQANPPSNLDAACGSLPSGTVETFQLGTKSTKFCKYIKDAKYVQWEGYGTYQSTEYVVLVRYPGTSISTVPAMPANVQKVLTTFTNS